MQRVLRTFYSEHWPADANAILRFVDPVDLFKYLVS